MLTGGQSVGNLQEVAGCRAAQTVLCRIVKNCAELCGSLQNCADCVAGGTGLAGSWCAGWAVGTHLQLHLQSAGGETFTQPSPASGVWRNGVSQARQAGAAPNLGWTWDRSRGPRTPQGYGDSVTSSDPSAAADTSQHQQPDFPDTEKLRHLAPASAAQHRLPSSHSRHVSKV